MARLFGTDGVRGVANEELTIDLAMKLGQAGAYVLTKEHAHKPTIMVGCDTRISGDMLANALMAGVCSVGANAVYVGVMPTPAVAYLTKKYKVDAGVVISASHNPVEFNGIKFFDGNGYGEEWVKEATEVRGLSNLMTTADAMPKLLDKKNMDMLQSHKVFTEAEIHSRCEIMLENYVKTVNIEGLTMVDMVRKNYLPAIERYLYRLSQTTVLMRQVSENVKCKYEVSTMERLSELTDYIMDAVIELEEALAEFKTISDVFKSSEFVRDTMLPRMDKLRKFVDEAEMLTSQRDWPFPSYGQLLFSVN